jgi:hypothetical protein
MTYSIIDFFFFGVQTTGLQTNVGCARHVTACAHVDAAMSRPRLMKFKKVFFSPHYHLDVKRGGAGGAKLVLLNSPRVVYVAGSRRPPCTTVSCRLS